MKSKSLILFLLLSCISFVSAQFFHFDAVLGMQHADISVADIDNDGDLDVIASGEAIENGAAVSKNAVLINKNAVFEQQTATEKKYTNPVFEPDFADPSVIRAADGWFYAYGTENTWTDGVHHIVPVIRSKDLIQWHYVADVFSARPTWKSDGGVWAPDVNFVNGKYYMYYSVSTWGDSNPGIGLAVADQPGGPFVDQGKVFDSSSIGVANSIDPNFVQVNSGNTVHSYLIWGSFHGIYGIELASDLKTTVGNKFKIAGNAFEAACIYQKDGKFYFFGSLGSCCDGVNSQYRVAVASATNIKGPYLAQDGSPILPDDAQGKLLIRGSDTLGWVGPGHNSKLVTDDAGNNFFVYHAIDISKPDLPGGATRRPMMMERINWVNGWPTVTGGLPGKTPQSAPQINP